MGNLAEVTIVRLRDGVKFDGHAWTTEKGFQEAFWHEDGVRMNFFFYADGTQKAMFMGTGRYQIVKKHA